MKELGLQTNNMWVIKANILKSFILRKYVGSVQDSYNKGNNYKII